VEWNASREKEREIERRDVNKAKEERTI